jgi:ribose 5-phosphate isomerase B
MTIPIASDHAGFAAKQETIQILKNHQYEVEDYGPFSYNRVDYPDFAIQVSKAVNDGNYECGILICGSGP